MTTYYAIETLEQFKSAVAADLTSQRHSGMHLLLAEMKAHDYDDQFVAETLKSVRLKLDINGHQRQALLYRIRADGKNVDSRFIPLWVNSFKARKISAELRVVSRMETSDRSVIHR